MPRPRKKTLDGKPIKKTTLVLPQRAIDLIDKSRPLASQVYGVLRYSIIEMSIEPGKLIPERDVCELLQVSRTPIREALLRLSEEGLVHIVPNSGTYVSKINLDSVFEGQLVRRALERETARAAALRMTPESTSQLDISMFTQRRLAADRDLTAFYEADEEFHKLICQIGTSDRVWRIIHSTKAQLDRVRRLAFPLPNHMETVLEEHATIVAAIVAGDTDSAVAAVDRHLNRVVETVKALVSGHPDLFSEDAQSTIDDYTILF
jgi:DNA-binding GntR family transcriptional regulator